MDLNNHWSPLESENTMGTGNLVTQLWDKSFPLVCNRWKSISSATGCLEGQNTAGVQGQEFLLQLGLGQNRSFGKGSECQSTDKQQTPGTSQGSTWRMESGHHELSRQQDTGFHEERPRPAAAPVL